MTAFHAILDKIGLVLMGIGVTTFYVVMQYRRQRTIVENLEHKADIQTLFGGRKWAGAIAVACASHRLELVPRLAIKNAESRSCGAAAPRQPAERGGPSNFMPWLENRAGSFSVTPGFSAVRKKSSI